MAHTESDNQKDAGPWPQERLAQVREEIDSVDTSILELLNRRAAMSLEVGRIKAGNKDIIFKPFREKEVLQTLVTRNSGPLPEEHLRAIYREVFSSSRSLQRPQRVAYLGPEGTFSYFAGVEFLGRSVEYAPMPDLHDVFRAVHAKEAELGVIPLENSLQGTVGPALDLFLSYEAFIHSEIFYRINHSLLSTVSSLSEVRAVYSHPQPLAQCGGWLRANLPTAKIIPTESTAAAARRVAEGRGQEQGAAAISHKGLGPLLDLNVLAQGIEDMPDNWTRFVIIGSAPTQQGAKDKTSMLFTVPDKPGSLVTVLQLLAREGINMKKLESRPMRSEKWKYVFFVDVECDLEQERYRQVLEELGHACHSLRVLGSYPAGLQVDATVPGNAG